MVPNILYFHPDLGKIDSYFSDGLKPPTRVGYNLFTTLWQPNFLGHEKVCIILPFCVFLGIEVLCFNPQYGTNPGHTQFLLQANGAGRDPEGGPGGWRGAGCDLELLLMVQESHSQPPFGCINTLLNNGIIKLLINSTGESRISSINCSPRLLSTS